MTQPIEELVWHGCYAEQWGDFLHPEAFRHPAKFAPGLIARILDHGLAVGWWRTGELLGDPFGGIGSGGLMAAYRGLRWLGIELEEMFVELAGKNFERHRSKLAALGYDVPCIASGDSRFFDERVALVQKIMGRPLAVAGAVTSPPFTQGFASGGGINVKGYEGKCGKDEGLGARHYQGTGAVRDDQNIERLPAGTIDAALTSPPYAGIAAGAGGLNHLPPKHVGQQSGRAHGPSQDTDQRYGHQAGQIAALKEGNVDGVVTSPPWEKNVAGHIGAEKFADPKAFAAEMVKRDAANPRCHKQSLASREAQLLRDKEKHYGASEGQIGQESGETYWQAMRKVYAAVGRALRPGGVMAVVVKDYVKSKARVPLCADTLRLLVRLGFVPVARIRAMLVSEERHTDLFAGETVKETSRKSFFRRLAEAKGSPRIDWEEVLVVRAPNHFAGGAV